MRSGRCTPGAALGRGEFATADTDQRLKDRVLQGFSKREVGLLKLLRLWVLEGQKTFDSEPLGVDSHILPCSCESAWLCSIGRTWSLRWF